MTQWSKDQGDALERLSEMIDGEAEPTAVERLCAAWGDEPAARASWHAYHLIGDVLRSTDLSSDAKRDAAFLRALRERLAKEPTVVTPAAQELRVPTRRSTVRPGIERARRPWYAGAWAGGGAIAAGFVAVAGVVLVMQAPTSPPAPTLALSPDAPATGNENATGPATAIAEAALTEPLNVVASGKVIRDARLEQYLAAHKQFGGSSALGIPSGFLRNATVEVPKR